MDTSSLEIPEVMVGDKPVSMEELDNVRNAVCLLKCTSKHTSKQWSGFYANVKTRKKDETLDMNCILTAYDDIFLEMDEHGGDMVAVFHHESDEEEAFELPLVSLELPHAGGERPPKYALFFIDESEMDDKGMKPILADRSQLPDVQPNDKVYMIHHPEKMKKPYSEDNARHVTENSIQYHANTLAGPSGSPVFVLRESKFLLVAMHAVSFSQGEGVLVSHILDDLYTLDVSRRNPFVKALSGLEVPIRRGSSLKETDTWSFSYSIEKEPPRSSPSKYEKEIKHGSVAPRRRALQRLSEMRRKEAQILLSLKKQSLDSDLDDLLVECKVPSTRIPRSIQSQSADIVIGSSWRAKGSSLYRKGAGLDPKIAETSWSTSDDEDTVKFQEESEWKSSRSPRLDSKIPEISRSSSDDEGTKFKGKGEWKPSQSYKITRTITVDGCAIETDDITLNAGQGCLAENTDIVMERVDHQFDVLKSLLDLRLVDAAPRVVKFSPDGLKFVKPVDLTIKFEKTATDSERFILHGFYNPVYQRIIWELVTNGVEEKDVEGVIHVKINSFSFYMFFLSTYRFLAQILNHINRSPICLACSFFRRSPLKDTIDIAVVLVSEFDENKENNIKHLIAGGFVKGEKGVLKHVNNDHLEMSLHFPGIETRPYPFQIDQYLVDSVGFVIDHFKKIAVMAPANGEVTIRETVHRDENESLWTLNVYEINQEIQAEVAQEQSASPDHPPAVVNRTTKLTDTEVTSMSQEIGAEWDDVAALLDISYSDREHIRMNNVEHVTPSSKAEQVLKLFNDSECFDRHTLVKCLEELQRHDLKNIMLSVNDEDKPEEMTIPGSQPESFDVQDDTRLSSRELYRLSLSLVVNWETLASLLGISRAKKDNILYCVSYFKSHSRAEKMLAIFNNMEDFSRQKLAEYLEEIGQLDLKEPVITGKWRKQ